MYPNRDFWFEKKPSGNPALEWLRLAKSCLHFDPIVSKFVARVVQLGKTKKLVEN
jgi:hypothetical protein